VLLAAGVVHLTISTFWTLVLHALLPRKNRIVWAVVASAGIAILDLRLIGRVIPAIDALEFWPQMVDHLTWGATVGYVLQRRGTKRISNLD
jgi:hypothetical protein